ncbi:hypothetical protein GGX14DRAFT_652403 [Mycena pura]|uniref:Uncharacterized protein n=1 Tax=Mycena pura TaxID=153505 RepID=A0AAD6V7G1_9AGAR|nr:hypothetical protein GGX14DRAFT_652403 [Mycena pura]
MAESHFWPKKWDSRSSSGTEGISGSTAASSSSPIADVCPPLLAPAARSPPAPPSAFQAGARTSGRRVGRGTQSVRLQLRHPPPAAPFPPLVPPATRRPPPAARCPHSASRLAGRLAGGGSDIERRVQGGWRATSGKTGSSCRRAGRTAARWNGRDEQRTGRAAGDERAAGMTWPVDNRKTFGQHITTEVQPASTEDKHGYPRSGIRGLGIRGYEYSFPTDGASTDLGFCDHGYPWAVYTYRCSDLFPIAIHGYGTGGKWIYIAILLDPFANNSYHPQVPVHPRVGIRGYNPYGWRIARVQVRLSATRKPATLAEEKTRRQQFPDNVGLPSKDWFSAWKPSIHALMMSFQ